MEFLADMVWINSAIRNSWFHLAAIHLSFFARRQLAHPCQHVRAVDVWTRCGARMGPAPILYLLLPMRCRRGRDQYYCQDDSGSARTRKRADSDHWRVRSDLRRTDCGGGSISTSTRAADSVSRGDFDACLRGNHGRDRVFWDTGRWRRQCEPHLPSWRHARRLSLFATRILSLFLP